MLGPSSSPFLSPRSKGRAPKSIASPTHASTRLAFASSIIGPTMHASSIGSRTDSAASPHETREPLRGRGGLGGWLTGDTCAARQGRRHFGRDKMERKIDRRDRERRPAGTPPPMPLGTPARGGDVEQHRFPAEPRR